VVVQRAELQLPLQPLHKFVLAALEHHPEPECISAQLGVHSELAVFGVEGETLVLVDEVVCGRQRLERLFEAAAGDMHLHVVLDVDRDAQPDLTVVLALEDAGSLFAVANCGLEPLLHPELFLVIQAALLEVLGEHFLERLEALQILFIGGGTREGELGEVAVQRETLAHLFVGLVHHVHVGHLFEVLAALQAGLTLHAREQGRKLLHASAIMVDPPEAVALDGVLLDVLEQIEAEG